MIDHYEILQVSPHAEPEIIEAAYRRLALKYHPDTNKTASATERMKWINQAYTVLSDPVQRAQYDAARNAYRATLRRQSSSAPPSTSATTSARTTPAATPAATNTSATNKTGTNTTATDTAQSVLARPQPHRLRACLTLVVLIALGALALWALQRYDLFTITDYIPSIP